jgi:hypothetical protein
MILIVGSAPGWNDEFAEMHRRYPDAIVIALNFTGEHIHCDYWITLHSGLMPPGWHEHDGAVSNDDCRIENRGGTVGLYAAMWALDNFDDNIVLCGCPIEGRCNGITGAEYNYNDRSMRLAWLGQMERLKCRVRSMSGWTRQQLGGPDD